MLLSYMLVSCHFPLHKSISIVMLPEQVEITHGSHGASTDVSDLAGNDQVMQSSHSLFMLDRTIANSPNQQDPVDLKWDSRSVDLEQINVVCVETLQARVDGIEDGGTRKSPGIDEAGIVLVDA